MKPVHVAVGVIEDSRARILITLRREDAHQGGLWEFPGGKLEQGESVKQALARELREELGIEVVSTRPLLQVEHNYGDKTVVLDVWLVSKFRGEAIGREGQPLCWVEPGDLKHYQFPAANDPIVDFIQAL